MEWQKRFVSFSFPTAGYVNPRNRGSLLDRLLSNQFPLRHIYLAGRLTFQDNEPYNWLLVYQDHFTKFVRLRALVNKSAEKVANALMDFFCDLGAPLILQSNNGREFKNALI